MLEIIDPDQLPWMAQQSTEAFVSPDGNGGKLHLLLGDSIARDAGISVTSPNLMLNRVRGGDSWRRLCDRVATEMRDWRRAAAGYGVPLGNVVIWMTGNDIYPDGTSEKRRQQLSSMQDHMTIVLDAVNECAEEVHIIGSLPRLAHDKGRAWEQINEA